MQDSRTVKPERAPENLAPKQRQILRSTYKMMGIKGVNNLALQDVADDAGVSKALLFYHFKTKESLILATLEWVLNRVSERIRVAIAPVQTAEAKVEAMIGAIFIRPDLNREFYLVYCDLIGYAARLDTFSAVASTFHNTANQMYADVVAMGMREGVFPTRDANAVGAAVRALIDGLFLQWLLEHDWDATHQSYRELCKYSILTYLHAA